MDITRIDFQVKIGLKNGNKKGSNKGLTDLKSMSLNRNLMISI